MGRDTKQQRFPFSQCSASMTRLSAVSNDNSNYFLTRLDILSQFGNMDDLLLAFAYNVKTTHFQPSSNKVLQPGKRWDVLCRINRECWESNFYNYLTFEKIQFAQRTHSNGIMENEHRRLCTYLQS